MPPWAGAFSVNTDLRVTLVVAALSSVLSFLVGLVARVGIGSAALRALVFGVLFGGLAWGAIFLMRSFIPDLFEPGGAAESDAVVAASFTVQGEEDDEGVGGSLDITVGEDDSEELMESAVSGGTLSSDGDERGGSDSLGEARSKARVSLSGDAEAEDEGTIFETDAASSGASAAAAIPRHSASGNEQLDTLPDLESIVGSYEQLSAGGGGASSTASGSNEAGSSGQGKAAGSGPNGSDPATLALAVRTLMNRDKKG